MRRTSFARGVPIFARFRESGKDMAGAGKTYEVKSFSYGLTLEDLGATGVMKTKFDVEATEWRACANAGRNRRTACDGHVGEPAIARSEGRW